MPMRNRVGRTSLHAIPAKNTSIVIDVVDFGVAFGAAYAVFGGVVGGFDVDAIGGTVGGAQEAGHAFLEAVFVALQHVSAAEAGFEPRSLERTFAVGIIFYLGGPEHLHKGDAHAFGDGGDVLEDRHDLSVYRKRRPLRRGSDPGPRCESAMTKNGDKTGVILIACWISHCRAAKSGSPIRRRERRLRRN